MLGMEGEGRRQARTHRGREADREGGMDGGRKDCAERVGRCGREGKGGTERDVKEAEEHK